MNNLKLNFYNNKFIHQAILEEMEVAEYSIFKRQARVLKELLLIQMYYLNLYKMVDKMRLQDKIVIKIMLMEK